MLCACQPTRRTKVARPRSEEAPQTPPVSDFTVTQGVPPMMVRVTDGSSLVHEGIGREGGDEFEMPGPMAQNLAATGYVTLL